MGTPALTKIVQTFSPAARGSVWSAITFAGNIGYMGSPFLMIPVLAYGWQMLFKACAIVAMVVAVASYYVISESPAANTRSVATTAKVDVASSLKLWTSLLTLDVWLWLFSEAFTTFALTGIVSWTGLYFIEHLSLSKSQAAQLILWSEVGTLFGVALCGPVSDLLRGRRDVTSSLFAGLCVPPLLSLTTSHSRFSVFEGLVSDYVWLSLGMLLVGVTINGPKTLATVGVRESVPEEIGGSICGLLGLLGQLGGAAAGAPLGHVIEVFGWSYLPVVLGASMACSSGCLALLSIRRPAIPKTLKQE